MLGIYIHIPFCVRKCGYCDFYSVAAGGGPLPVKSYLAALKRQLVNDVENMGLRSKPIETVYFGGGTPSLMPVEFFADVMGLISSHFKMADDAEISVEVNPATVGAKWFAGAVASGVNRCSIGVQSFHPRLLKTLGRIHSKEDAMRAIAEAQDGGFRGVSLDLMFGIPSETMAEMEDDVRTAMMFQPEHISAYQLTIEEGTELAKQEAGSRRQDEDLILKQMRAVARMLSRGGWERYEISNYAKKDHECRHNLNYWSYGEYLGLGAGAVTFIKRTTNDERRTTGFKFGVRYAQARDVGKYIEGKGTVEEDVLDASKAMGEFCFLGLRKTDGFATADFEGEFGREFRAVYGKVGDELVKDRLIEDAGGRLVLTPRGLELSNHVFEKFIA